MRILKRISRIIALGYVEGLHSCNGLTMCCRCTTRVIQMCKTGIEVIRVHVEGQPPDANRNSY